VTPATAQPGGAFGAEPPGVILVGVDLGQAHFDATLAELEQLALSAGYRVCDKVVCRRRAPDPALYVGSGKADEIQALAAASGASEVLFDQTLSPAQQRNLERRLNMPVNDRVLLILNIFAQRARSHEGKLQVELARLQYLATRLVRRWSHLERQTGGIGLRGGPGETQIELDRRMIAEAIQRTRTRLARVQRQRHTQRRQRTRRGTFDVSLVGYTNAGKSTLFNALVKARAYAADQLFATLDTTTREWFLGEIGRSVTLSDTVGFIRELPHTLVAAFAATLQEARDADLLLHVVDAANPEHLEQIQAVMQVLHEIEAASIPQVLVFNKVDALPAQRQPRQTVDQMELEGRVVTRVFVSAHTGQGLDALRAVVADAVRAQRLAAEAMAADCGTIAAIPTDSSWHS
jgi:GTP-binding protein HflX